MKKLHPAFLLILATILWGGNFVIGKAVANSISPFTLAFFRWCIACMVFFPVVFHTLKLEWRQILYHWKIVIVLALTGVAGFNTFVYIGVHYTTSINASLMNMLTPIFIYILSFVFLRERLNKFQLLGTFISFIGVLLIISNGSFKSLLHFTFNKGDLIILLAVLLWSIYSLLIKQYAHMLPGRSTFFISMIFGTFMLLPFFLYEQLVLQTTINWSLPTISAIFYVGIFASIVAFLSWNFGVVQIGANRAGIYLNFIPVFATIFAVFFLNEQLHTFQIIGGFFVLCGVFVTSKK